MLPVFVSCGLFKDKGSVSKLCLSNNGFQTLFSNPALLSNKISHQILPSSKISKKQRSQPVAEEEPRTAAWPPSSICNRIHWNLRA